MGAGTLVLLGWQGHSTPLAVSARVARNNAGHAVHHSRRTQHLVRPPRDNPEIPTRRPGIGNQRVQGIDLPVLVRVEHDVRPCHVVGAGRLTVEPSPVTAPCQPGAQRPPQCHLLRNPPPHPAPSPPPNPPPPRTAHIHTTHPT